MSLCTDPALTYLNGIGYNVVRVPRRGINPLDILGRDGRSLERLGRIDQIWSSSDKVPTETGPDQATQITGQKTNEMTCSVGMKLLNGILGALGGQVPHLELAFSAASSVQFTFGEVTTRGVDAFAVGSFLGHGDLSGTGPIFDRYFHNEETHTYIITEVIEAKSVSVEARNKHSESVTVEVPLIKDAVGGNIGVSAAAGSSTAVTFTGTTAVAFGFKAFNIAYDGKWRMSGAPPSAALAFSPGQGQSPVLISNLGALRI